MRHLVLFIGLAASVTACRAQTWERAWLDDPQAPAAEMMLARFANAPCSPAALLVVAETEAEWGQRAARVWAHSGFTVLLLLRPTPAPTTAPARFEPSPPQGGPAVADLRHWEARLRDHSWASGMATPLWLVTRETLPEVAALAQAGHLVGREVVALDGPPRPASPTAATVPRSNNSPPTTPAPPSSAAPGHWWSPARAAELYGEPAPPAAGPPSSWTRHPFSAGPPDDAFDASNRLGRARIAADVLRTAAATIARTAAPSSPDPAPEALPTLHLTLRRLLALGCAFALSLAIWAAWRGWRAARPGLTRHSLALLGGGLWLLAAGLTVARGLGPELPLALAARLGLAPTPLAAGESDPVARAERADITLAEAQDRQRLVRLVLSHWSAYLPTAPVEAAEWCALVAEPVVGLPPPSARQIEAPSPGLPETRWRRALWDNLYPRIRQVATPASAARAAAWHLRLQVRLDPPTAFAHASTASPARWFDAWRTRRMTPAQFEYLLVAGLRAVGLPARLRADGRAEHRAGAEWQPVWFDEGARPDEAHAPPVL